MKSRPAPLVAAVCVLALLVLVGVATTATVVRNEGVEGLFRRKRDAVRKVAPETLPIVDEVESRVRSDQP